jgi:hypothetical protein
MSEQKPDYQTYKENADQKATDKVTVMANQMEILDLQQQVKAKELADKPINEEAWNEMMKSDGGFYFSEKGKKLRQRHQAALGMGFYSKH